MQMSRETLERFIKEISEGRDTITFFNGDYFGTHLGAYVTNSVWGLHIYYQHYMDKFRDWL